MPAGATVLPETVSTETVPPLRLATSASFPSGLNDTPDGPAPTSTVAITAGGDALRSITATLLSSAVFLGSAGSSLVAAVTSAMLSSGAMATLCGTPTTDAPRFTWPSTLGGETPMSRIMALSGGGLSTTLLVPSTLTTLFSCAETAICAAAGAAITKAEARVRTKGNRKQSLGE